MTTDSETRVLSGQFTQLYCDPAAFGDFSRLHPISFRRVLPVTDGVDDPRLLDAEEVHLAQQNDYTRRTLVDEYCRRGLLDEPEARDLRGIIDFFEADFFDLMGLVYANAGMFGCALRWQREMVVRLETQKVDLSSDLEPVYASVGYCLYSLGLFEEAIAWSKSCLGPLPMADSICRALLEYEAQLAGGTLRSIERAGNRTRYSVSTFEPEHASQTTPRLKAAMKTLAPFQDVYVDWVAHETPTPEIQTHGYPFKAEFDGGTLVRHKMNLLFATCAQADALAERGQRFEAKRLLAEAFLLEPDASMVNERLEALS